MSLKMLKILNQNRSTVDKVQFDTDKPSKIGPMLEDYLAHSKLDINKISMPKTLDKLSKEFNIKALSICLIDDDEDYLEISKMYLNHMGHFVRAYSNPEFAYDDIKKNPHNFDMFLVDQNMPQISGGGLIKLINEFDVQSRIYLMSSTIDTIPSSYSKEISVVKKPRNILSLL